MGSDLKCSAGDGHLLLRWSKRERDFLVSYPRRRDGHLAMGIFTQQRQVYDWMTKRVTYERSIVDELAARGYDPKTLRFSIKRATEQKANQ